MNENFLFDLLVDPVTKEKLDYINELSSLRSPGGERIYPIIESVPRIMIGDDKHILESSLHHDYQSNFYYSDHYEKDAVRFDYSEQDIPKITRNEIKRLHESILKEIPDELSLILDVGCGNGWVSKELIPLGKKVISMDISSENPINSIREVHHKNHAGLIADVYNVPIMNNSIDCIIASEILEHVQDPKAFIARLICLLKPNGKLIITSPFNEKIEYSLCVHCNKPTPRHAHLHSFNENNIKQIIPPEGIIWSSKTFMNKYLSIIRSYIILRHFSFDFWIQIDNLFNKFAYWPLRLKIVIIRV